MRSILSQRANAIDASGIRKVFDLAAKLPDPINLSIGLPDFDVPTPAKAAAVEAIENGLNRYTPTQGIASLRERLRKDLSAEIGRDVGDVLITSGVSGGLLLAMLAVLDPGDEVVFLDPAFVGYRHVVTMTGAIPVMVDSYPDFRFDPLRVEAAITAKTKVMIVASPANPTGVVMTPAEIQAAVELARKHDLLLVSDEIYEPFLYERSGDGSEESAGQRGAGVPALSSRPAFPDSQLPYSPAELYEKTLILRGFSKSHAMTGWRIGYAAGPAELIGKMATLQQYTFVCPPSPLQYGALAALDLDMSGHVADYRAKRDLVCDLLAPNFEIVRPGGAFYVFPKAPAGMTSTDFVTKAIEHNVLIIPGNVFSPRDTHFRISYATTDEKLRAGCAVLNSLA